MDLAGSTVAVVGLGKSGASSCQFCAARGARVIGFDSKSRPDLGEVGSLLDAAGVTLRLGDEGGGSLVGADLVVVSPGVPPTDQLAEAEAAGIPIVAEVELASWFLEAPIVGITGTNGKSTVTALIGAMLEAAGRPTFVGGNFGVPLVDVVGTAPASAGGALVVELSSFQLERIDKLRPRVAVLLNITEDHLDRYPSMAEYAAAKGRLLVAQTSDDHVVVDGVDPTARALAEAGRARVHPFGGDDGEVRVEGELIIDHGAEGGQERYAASLLKIAGAHNRQNAAAAILAARLSGASPTAIREGLGAFAGLPHRMEWVGETGGVSFYDDSKATNVGAAVAALRGVDKEAVLIAGGRDKGGDYGPLREQVEEKGRAVVLIGEAADTIAGALDGAAPIERAASMDEAVERAATLARAGDIVVLAPACSSFDMYVNFNARGEDFARAVRVLLGRKRG